MKVLKVNKAKIRSSRNNARKKPLEGERRAAFLDSIKEHGILVPLIGVVAATDLVDLVDGNSRLELGCEAGIEDFPVCILDRVPNESELLTAQLVINETRNGLNAVDLFEAYSKLLQLNGWSHLQLANTLTVSEAKVTSVMSLGRFSPEQQQLIRDKDVSLSAAYAIGRLPSQKWDEMLKQAAAGKVTRDQLNGHARKSMGTGDVRLKRVTFATSRGTFSIQSDTALNLDDAIERAQGLTRDLKKLRAQRLDISTAAKVLRDQSKANSN